jgi:hypothetical protein
MLNLTFINDTTTGWVHHTLEKTITQHTSGNPNLIITRIDDIQHLTGDSIFGEPQLYLYTANDKNTIDTVTGRLKEYQTTKDGTDFSHGLIITSILPKNRVQRLTNLTKTLGGTYYTSEKKTTRAHATEAFKNTPLTRPVKNMILDWVGDNTEDIYSTLNSISALPVEEQKNLTPETLYPHLPYQPGVKPPWNIPDALLAGDVKQSIITLRGTRNNTGFVIAYLRTYFESLYTISTAITLNPRISDKNLSQLVGVSGWVLKKRRAQAQQHTPTIFQHILDTIIETSQNMTGGSRVDNTTLIEHCFFRIHTITTPKPTKG